jgi:ArsR family metal-binding transcriptional regulator
LAVLLALPNQAWARREEIKPKREGRRAPRPLDVYELLPRTNCGACGEVTCMAFAFGLLESRHRPEECAGLVASQVAAHLHAMIALLCDIGEAPAGRSLHALD